MVADIRVEFIQQARTFYIVHHNDYIVYIICENKNKIYVLSINLFSVFGFKYIPISVSLNERNGDRIYYYELPLGFIRF